jgi:hypothetical protein
MIIYLTFTGLLALYAGTAFVCYLVADLWEEFFK